MKELISKNIQKNNGITLIALVITIIILLILAGISISMLTGENGILTKARDAKDNTMVETVRESAEIIRGEYLANNNGKQPAARYIIEKLIQQGKINSSDVTDYGDETGIGKITVLGKNIDIVGNIEDYYVYFEGEIEDNYGFFYLFKTNGEPTDDPEIFTTAYIIRNNNRTDISSYIIDFTGTDVEGHYHHFSELALENLVTDGIIPYGETVSVVCVKDGVEYYNSIELPKYKPVNMGGTIYLGDRARVAGNHIVQTTLDGAYVIKNGQRVNINSYLVRSEVPYPEYSEEFYDSIPLFELISDGILTENEVYTFILVKEGKEYEIEASARVVG